MISLSDFKNDLGKKSKRNESSKEYLLRTNTDLVSRSLTLTLSEGIREYVLIWVEF